MSGTPELPQEYISRKANSILTYASGVCWGSPRGKTLLKQEAHIQRGETYSSLDKRPAFQRLIKPTKMGSVIGLRENR
ncbi:hypothetical protein E4T56_gene3546 [Termitomyces sp. T112]|nr:hypothetical protein E4T56_gene3546 [Termitomyces sp. T112]